MAQVLIQRTPGRALPRVGHGIYDAPSVDWIIQLLWSGEEVEIMTSVYIAVCLIRVKNEDNVQVHNGTDYQPHFPQSSTRTPLGNSVGWSLEY